MHNFWYFQPAQSGIDGILPFSFWAIRGSWWFSEGNLCDLSALRKLRAGCQHNCSRSEGWLPEADLRWTSLDFFFTVDTTLHNITFSNRGSKCNMRGWHQGSEMSILRKLKTIAWYHMHMRIMHIICISRWKLPIIVSNEVWPVWIRRRITLQIVLHNKVLSAHIGKIQYGGHCLMLRVKQFMNWTCVRLKPKS